MALRPLGLNLRGWKKPPQPARWGLAWAAGAQMYKGRTGVYRCGAAGSKPEEPQRGRVWEAPVIFIQDFLEDRFLRGSKGK